MVSVGVALFGHQMDDARLDAYGWQLEQLHRKGAPFTFYFTGATLEAIRDRKPLVRRKIIDMFPQNAGALNPYCHEIGASATNHMNMVPIGDFPLDQWSTWFMHFTDPQIRRAKEVLYHDFEWKNGRGYWCPECIFAPAAGWWLAKNGVDYVVVDGGRMNGWQQGQVFHMHDGPRLVPIAPQISLFRRDPHDIVQDVYSHCHRFPGTGTLVLAGDFDFDNYGRSMHGGISYLCKLADELHGHGVDFRNIASIADHNRTEPYPFDHHFTTSWMGDGGLGCLGDDDVRKKNDRLNDCVGKYGWLRFRLEATRGQIAEWRSYGNLWDWYHSLSHRLDNARDDLMQNAAGMEYRHPCERWNKDQGMNDRFWGATDHFLAEYWQIHDSLNGLESHAFH